MTFLKLLDQFWLLIWAFKVLCHFKMLHHVNSKSVKVQRADLTCDVIKKVAPFVLSKL